MRPITAELANAVNVVNVPLNGRNPYQHLLYGSDTGPFRPTQSAAGLNDLVTLAAGPDPAIFHLHWEDRIFGRTKDRDANRAAAEAELAKLRAFKEAGGRLIWTIHNGRPHRERDPDTFEFVRGSLCEFADLIHVHAPHAAAHMTDEWGAAPEKIRIIRHPSYLGHYEAEEQTLARPVAPSEARRFLFFGMFRMQKGLSLLQTAAGRMARRSDKWSMRVVGKGFASQRRMVRHFNRIPGVSVEMDRVPDQQIPNIFGEAHAFVAPFDDFFTSGTVLLALTFGLPVIGPDCVEMRQMVPRACWDLLYPEQKASHLVLAMSRLVNMPEDELAERRLACFAHAQATHSRVISRYFQRALAEICLSD